MPAVVVAVKATTTAEKGSRLTSDPQKMLLLHEKNFVASATRQVAQRA
jgi:hypothetical protein